MNSFVCTSAGHEAKKDPQILRVFIGKGLLSFDSKALWVARYKCNGM